MIYRPPQSSVKIFNEYISNFFNDHLLPNKSYIVLGDFNHDLLKINLKFDPIVQLFRQFSFRHCHMFPTRTTQTSSTCIDWILANTNSFSKIQNISAVDIGCSDHKFVLFEFKKTRNKTQKMIQKEIEIFSKHTINCFYDMISEFIPTTDSFDNFFSQINSAKIFCFRKKYINACKSDCSNDNYLSNKFFTLCFKRDHIFHLYKSTNSIEYFTQYKFLKNKANRLAKDEKIILFQNKIKSSRNPKEMWQTMKYFIPKPGENKCFEINISADEFNHFFSTIVPKLLILNFPQISLIKTLFEPPKIDPINSFHFYPITPYDVFRLFNNFKSCSIDSNYLTHKIFNLNPEAFSQQICILINNSLNDCNFPNCLKISKVIPVFKKGDHRKKENYRPISILPTISKLFEKVISRQIWNFINEHNYMHSNQFGFTPKNSCETAVTYLLSKIYKAIQNNETAIVIFLDFSKAFDSITHSILLKKLSTNFKFSYNAVKTIESYLTNRKQYTSVGDCNSSLADIIYGVPQGSILGPLLFNIYTNDIHSITNNTTSNLILYADDTIILSSNNNINKLIIDIKISLQNLETYCCKNKLILNIEKCKYIIINNKMNYDFKEHIKINNKIIEKVQSYKYLGFTIDDRLNFNIQINHIKNKLTTCIAVLDHCRLFLPSSCLLLIYYSIGLSYINYYKCILFPLSSNKLGSLKLKLRQCKKFILFPNLQHIDIFDLDTVLNYYFALSFHKIINKKHSPILQNDLSYSSHKYILRSYNIPQFSFSSSSLCQNNFYFYAPLFWSTLPTNLTSVINFTQFKKLLSTFLQ